MKLGLGTGSTAEAFLDLLAPEGGGRARDRRRADLRAHGRQGARARHPHRRARRHRAPRSHHRRRRRGRPRSQSRSRAAAARCCARRSSPRRPRRMVVIADGSKLVERLGRYALPVEVVGFGARTTIARIEAAIAGAGLWRHPDFAAHGRRRWPFRTDSGHLIFDCAFGAITDAPALAARAVGGARRGRSRPFHRHRHRARHRARRTASK